MMLITKRKHVPTETKTKKATNELSISLFVCFFKIMTFAPGLRKTNIKDKVS